jgi:periplasmic protein TonB
MTFGATPLHLRNARVAVGAVLLHMAALWFLQAGLGHRPQSIVPVQALAAFIAPAAAPAPAAAQALPMPAPKKPAPTREVARPAPAQPDTAALRQRRTPAQEQVKADSAAPPAQSSTNVATAPVAEAAVPAAPEAARAPVVEQPSSDAEYLQNPKPSYPVLSRRLREQGKVIVRVLIGVDGRASRAEIRQSSGYERLDQAALTTVQAWRYVPGRRGGVPEAMWFNVPINFVLE